MKSGIAVFGLVAATAVQAMLLRGVARFPGPGYFAMTRCELPPAAR